MKCICINSEEVLADIRSASWLEQELHPELDRHRRHQMADICEPDNADRVWRVLGVSIAEIRLELLRIIRPPARSIRVDELVCPEEWIFSFLFTLPPDVVSFLREKIHEYLVAAVMADRTEVIIPQCAYIWRERAQEARSALRGIAATARPPYSPARRPMWPM